MLDFLKQKKMYELFKLIIESKFYILYVKNMRKVLGMLLAIFT